MSYTSFEVQYAPLYWAVYYPCYKFIKPSHYFVPLLSSVTPEVNIYLDSWYCCTCRGSHEKEAWFPVRKTSFVYLYCAKSLEFSARTPRTSFRSWHAFDWDRILARWRSVHDSSTPRSSFSAFRGSLVAQGCAAPVKDLHAAGRSDA